MKPNAPWLQYRYGQPGSQNMPEVEAITAFTQKRKDPRSQQDLHWSLRPLACHQENRETDGKPGIAENTEPPWPRLRQRRTKWYQQRDHDHSQCGSAELLT